MWKETNDNSVSEFCSSKSVEFTRCVKQAMIEWKIEKENDKSDILEFNLSVFWQAAAFVMKACIAWRRTETWIRQKTRRATWEKALYCIRRGCHNLKSKASDPLSHWLEFHRLYGDGSRAIFCDLLTYIKLSYDFKHFEAYFCLKKKKEYVISCIDNWKEHLCIYQMYSFFWLYIR